MLPRAAVYCRVSHPSQVKYGGSLEYQIKALPKLAQQKGFLVDPSDIYVEPGISGKNDNRPEYNRMLAAIIEGQYNALFVFDITRLTRTDSREEQGRIIKILANAGCDLHTESAHYDLNNPESRFLFGIGAEVALLDNSLRARKVTIGKSTAREKGNNPGQAIPTGYSKWYSPEGKLYYVIDDEAIKPVKLAYELALKGYGGTHILKELTRKGFRNKQGGLLSLSHVYQWLKNPSFAGYVHVGMSRGSKTKQKGMWPSQFIKGTVCTLEEWEKIQVMLDSRKHTRERYRFPLSGILVCPSCGEKMIGTYKGTKIKVRYYACQPPANEPDRYCHGNFGKSIKMNVAHELVVKAMPELLEQIKEHDFTSGETDTEKNDTAEIKKAIAKTERKIQTLINLLEENPSDYLKDRLVLLEKQVKILKNDLAKVKKPTTKEVIGFDEFLNNAAIDDNGLWDEIFSEMFMKLHISREGTHRNYIYTLRSVTFKWGEIYLLKSNIAVLV